MIRCGTCGADIIWCRTETGKRMPVDAKPNKEGNLTIDHTEMLPTVRPVSRGTHKTGQPLYKSHFATCKDATKHRTPKKPPLPPPGPVLFQGGGEG